MRIKAPCQAFAGKGTRSARVTLPCQEYIPAGEQGQRGGPAHWPAPAEPWGGIAGSPSGQIGQLNQAAQSPLRHSEQTAALSIRWPGNWLAGQA